MACSTPIKQAFSSAFIAPDPSFLNADSLLVISNLPGIPEDKDIIHSDYSTPRKYSTEGKSRSTSVGSITSRESISESDSEGRRREMGDTTASSGYNSSVDDADMGEGNTSRRSSSGSYRLSALAVKSIDYQSCDEHSDNPMCLFCNVCEVAICFECHTCYHATHRTSTLEVALIMKRFALKSQSGDLGDMTSQLETQLAQLTDSEEKMRRNKAMVTSSLQSRRDYLHQLIDKWYENTQFAVDETLSHELLDIQRRITDITRTLADIRVILNQAKDVLAPESPSDDQEINRVVDLHGQTSKLSATSQRLLREETQGDLTFMVTAGVTLNSEMLGNICSHRLLPSAGPSLHMLSQGKLVFNFDSRQAGKSVYMATGISVTPQGHLLVADIGMDTVKVFTQLGKLNTLLNTLPEEHPTKAVSFPDNQIAVVCKRDVKLFNADGTYDHKLNRNLESPQGITLSQNGDLVISDTHVRPRRGHFIHIFGGEGMELQHTIIGGLRAPCFTNPWYLTTDHHGNILVSDYDEHVIKIFNPDGVLVLEFGGQGAGMGQLFHPAGLCVDAYGNILVADCGNDRVQAFSPEGTSLGVVVAEHEGVVCPMDLTLDQDGFLWLLSGNGLVAKYQYLF